MINENEKMYKIIKRFILERFDFYFNMIFKSKDLHPILKVYTKEMMDNTIFDLVLHLYGKKQEQLIKLSTPKTWRDWIKKKHGHKKWMRWIIKRFPINYNYHNYILNEYTTFPNLDLPHDFEKKMKLVYYDYTKEEDEDNKIID